MALSTGTPRILLRSGWNMKNIGDVGHTPGTLRLLYDRFPQAQITVWARDIDEEAEAMMKRRFPSVQFVRGQMYEREAGCPEPLDRAFHEADLFLYGSGMLMNYGLFGFDWNGPVYNLVPLWRCIEQGIPFGLFGQSFDRFAYPSRWLFKPVLDQAAFIFTRETESAKYLRECGFEAPVMEFSPDGCFGIDVRDDEKADAWLEAHGLEAGGFLAVIIRTNTSTSPKHDSPLNPANPTSEQLAEQDRWLNTCATVIADWIHRTGLKVLVVPEAEKEAAAAEQLLRPRLADDVADRVVIRPTFWTVDEAVSTYGRSRAVFGVEPHSLIMALAMGVPIVHARPLRHGRKGWMFRDIGLGDWLYDIDAAPAQGVADTVVSLHTDHDDARHRVEQAMACVRQRHEHALDVIEDTLAGSN